MAAPDGPDGPDALDSLNSLNALGEPVRRRILELIGHDELPAGVVASALAAELGISQPATSQHLRVLREAGLLRVRAVGSTRLQRVDLDRLADAAGWFDQFAGAWQQPLDALETELARGRRERRHQSRDTPPTVRDRGLGPTGMAGSAGIAGSAGMVG